MKVVTVLNPSPVYTSIYVDELAKRLDALLVCITDTRWPSWWCKMSAFDPDRFDGPMLFMDLDTVPVDGVQPFLDYPLTESMMLRDFYNRDRPASGVMMITADDRAKVWREWMKSPQAFRQRHRILGDGAAIAEIIKPRLFLQDEFPGAICSYKIDCQHGQPEGVRLICYHGRPRPHETGWDTQSAARFIRRARVSFPPGRAFTLEQQKHAAKMKGRA